jgi:hypothetical protein
MAIKSPDHDVRRIMDRAVNAQAKRAAKRCEDKFIRTSSGGEEDAVTLVNSSG